jgi:hypothetical protein
MQNHLSKLLVGRTAKFLEHTLIPLNEARTSAVRGDMQSSRAALRRPRAAPAAQRDAPGAATRDAKLVLLATPPNDPNQLGLAILEPCHRRRQLPDARRGRAGPGIASAAIVQGRGRRAAVDRGIWQDRRPRS